MQSGSLISKAAVTRRISLSKEKLYKALSSETSPTISFAVCVFSESASELTKDGSLYFRSSETIPCVRSLRFSLHCVIICMLLLLL